MYVFFFILLIIISLNVLYNLYKIKKIQTFAAKLDYGLTQQAIVTKVLLDDHNLLQNKVNSVITDLASFSTDDTPSNKKNLN